MEALAAARLRATAALVLSCALPFVASAASATQPHILMIVADDLGYDDLGSYNGGKTRTPHIDALVGAGVKLDSYYTFKVCSPSRASIQSGRYPWSLGWYYMPAVAMDASHSLVNYTLLPQLIKNAGYGTHAFGKWDVGFMRDIDTPTRVGFDSFTGYYTAAQADYWNHTTTGMPCHEASELFIPWLTDLSYNNRTHIGPFARAGLNGTYNAKIFTSSAVQRVHLHALDRPGAPLFEYFAPQNVHRAGSPPLMSPHGGLQAPCTTVDSFPHVATAMHKAQAAMLAELDASVGNLTQAYKDVGFWNNTLVVFVSDNGGPLDHSTNGPTRRGGKRTFLEGGTRVVSFVSGPALPAAVRGTTWEGMAHSSDWLPTLVAVAGGSVPSHTGPRPLDGHNLWPALSTGGASPRTEVIHQVSNKYFSEHVSAIRVGDFKLIVGDPGDPRIISWPDAATAPTPFGGHRGTGVYANRCYAARDGIPAWNKTCITRPCLYNVVNDVAEMHDLGGDPAYADTVAKLKARLDAAGATGPPPSAVQAFPTKQAHDAATQQICRNGAQTGFLEPLAEHEWRPLVAAAGGAGAPRGAV